MKNCQVQQNKRLRSVAVEINFPVALFMLLDKKKKR